MAAPPVTATVPRLDLDDIQGLVARGYGGLRAAAFLLIGVDDGQSAARWLGELSGSITRATQRPDRRSVNVALTAPGLEALGLDASVDQGFSPEFVEGMLTPHRRRLLGDVESNAPEGWRWGGPTTPPVHVLLLLFALDSNELDGLRAHHVTALPPGLRLIATLETRELDAFEHFGFHDGISQPIVEGLSRRRGPWADTVRAGEVVLGYPNEYGLFTPGPFVPGSRDPEAILPDHPARPQAHDLGRDGSYLVVRQLRQYVHRFWQFVDAATRHDGDVDDGEARVKLAAKMVGRWPSGASLALTPDVDEERLADENDFGYHRPDPYGTGCPIGSHVRRANPRDALEPDPGSTTSVAVGKRHRILRRGRGYGPRIDVQAALVGTDESDQERGLHFMCLNANIARQFEFVQHTWVNDPRFNGLYEDPDPLVGAPSGSERAFTVQAHGLRTRLHGVPEFTAVRGGGYFFLPGLRAIRYLASLGA